MMPIINELISFFLDSATLDIVTSILLLDFKPAINLIMDYSGKVFGKADVPLALHRLTYTHKFFNDDNTFNLSYNKALQVKHYPSAADGHHPGLEWHMAVAQYLKNHLK